MYPGPGCRSPGQSPSGLPSLCPEAPAANTDWSPRPGKQSRTDSHRACLRIPSHLVAGVRMPDKLTRYQPRWRGDCQGAVEEWTTSTADGLRSIMTLISLARWTSQTRTVRGCWRLEYVRGGHWTSPGPPLCARRRRRRRLPRNLFPEAQPYRYWPACGVWHAHGPTPR